MKFTNTIFITLYKQSVIHNGLIMCFKGIVILMTQGDTQKTIIIKFEQILIYFLVLKKNSAIKITSCVADFYVYLKKLLV